MVVVEETIALGAQGVVVLEVVAQQMTAVVAVVEAAQKIAVIADHQQMTLALVVVLTRMLEKAVAGFFH